jgi:hypothetical protein
MHLRRIRSRVWFVRPLLALAFVTAGWRADAQERLRYRFAADSRVVYDVKISALLGDVREVREGTLTLEIEDSTDQETTIMASGNLGVRRQSRDGSPVMSMPNFRFGYDGPVSDLITIRPSRFSIDKSGGLVDIEVQTALPYMLGDFEQIVLDELPKSPTEETWTREREVSVIKNARSSPFPNMIRPPGFGPRGFGGPPGFRAPGFGPPGSGPNQEDSRSAREKAVWKIESREGGGIQVAKTYELKTDDKVNGRPRRQMTGGGEMTFDPLRGHWKSGLMQYDIEIQDDGVAVNIPVTVSFKRLTEAEIAKRAEEASASKARHEAIMKKAAEDAKPRPLSPEDRKSLLADLKSGDDRSIQKAGDRLAKAIVPDNPDLEIVSALVTAVSRTENFPRKAVASALAIWGSEKQEKEFVKLLASGDFLVREAAITGLSKCKTKTAAKALVMELTDLSARHLVSKVLVTMDPEFVEPELIPLLEDRDVFTRGETAKILQKIGTEKSIPALEKMRDSGQPFADRAAADAIKSIRLRHDTN